MSQKFNPNSRSFTCLLKEIDEEEEKNIVGSIPGGELTRINQNNFDKTRNSNNDTNSDVVGYSDG